MLVCMYEEHDDTPEVGLGVSFDFTMAEAMLDGTQVDGL